MSIGSRDTLYALFISAPRFTVWHLRFLENGKHDLILRILTINIEIKYSSGRGRNGPLKYAFNDSKWFKFKFMYGYMYILIEDIILSTVQNS